jgi:hypothetical protein
MESLVGRAANLFLWGSGHGDSEQAEEKRPKVGLTRFVHRLKQSLLLSAFNQVTQQRIGGTQENAPTNVCLSLCI